MRIPAALNRRVRLTRDPRVARVVVGQRRFLDPFETFAVEGAHPRFAHPSATRADPSSPS
jgi:hypothetical protein